MRFEKLDVWKRAARLSGELYQKLDGLNNFGFRDQITRSGLSIPSNIAEGSERDSEREFVRFINFARGSCAELRTQIYIGIRANFIDKELGNYWLRECDGISRMLHSLRNRLREDHDDK